jgi:hypothetical protein
MPMPVLPLVGSISVSPGWMRPFFCASSTMRLPMRSLTSRRRSGTRTSRGTRSPSRVRCCASGPSACPDRVEDGVVDLGQGITNAFGDCGRPSGRAHSRVRWAATRSFLRSRRSFEECEPRPSRVLASVELEALARREREPPLVPRAGHGLPGDRSPGTGDPACAGRSSARRPVARRRNRSRRIPTASRSARAAKDRSRTA